MNGTIDELAIFAAVARLGSITGAARELGLPKSTVSRRLTALEARLGLRLVERTTRRLRLSEAGESFYDDVRRILDELRTAESRVAAWRAEPSGLLRVTAPVEFGTALLGPLVYELTARYPKVDIDAVLTERLVDLVDEGFDIAIRAGSIPDSRLHARFLGYTQRLVCASPAYLEVHGAPAIPDDLRRHTTLSFRIGGSPGRWILEGKAGREEVRLSPRLISNNYTLLKEAAASGVGVALLPAFDCLEEITDGRLVALLPEWCSSDIPLNALYAGSREASAKLRIFLDALFERMKPLTWIQPRSG